MSALAVSLLPWVCGLVLLAAGLVVLQRRQPRPRGADAIRLVTSRYLGGRRFLTIVEVDGERLLLGVAGEQVSLVARLGRARAPEAEAGL